jgi:hypothetical protein
MWRRVVYALPAVLPPLVLGLPLTRRQRIRALAEISELIRNTPSDAALDPTSSAGAKVIQLIRSLAARTK